MTFKLLSKARLLAFSIAATFMLSFAVSDSLAQDAYCPVNTAATCPTTTCYDYPQYAYFYSVQIFELDDSFVFTSNSDLSGVDGHYDPSKPTLNRVESGQGYENSVSYVKAPERGTLIKGKYYFLLLGTGRYSSGYPTYTRIFMDWNGDADFKDNFTKAPEYFGTAYASSPQYNYVGVVLFVPCEAAPNLRLRVMTSYAYSNGNCPCINGYGFDASTCLSNYTYAYNYGETEDFDLSTGAGLKNMFPNDAVDADYVLQANELYDGTTRGGELFKKPFVELYSAQPAGTTMEYIIQGPLPSNNVVYRGLDSITGSQYINIGGKSKISIANATGSAAYAGGAFKTSNGGEYRLIIRVSGACGGEILKSFVVAWDNDISVRAITSPRTSDYPVLYKYQRGQQIRLEAVVLNSGLNPVYDFEAVGRVKNEAGQVVQTFNYMFHADNPSQGLDPQEKANISFGTFKTNNIGFYCFEVEVNLLSALDQEDYNDRMPRDRTSCYRFEVSYETQLTANDILHPDATETIIGNRPFRPVAEFLNNGIMVASNVPATMKVYKLPDLNNTVYDETVLIEDIQTGLYRDVQVEFPQMTLFATGQYRACISINHPEDEIPGDNEYCEDFYVSGGLSGTYTVGKRFLGSPRNIPTIDSAMTILYKDGVYGDVVFELTDAVYNQYPMKSFGTGLFSDYPAWDFRSRIIGLGIQSNGDTNTLTIKPTREMGSTRGSVVINLYSPNGKGIQFGQSLTPAYPQAIAYEFPNDIKNANNEGFVTIDGGPQKSIKLNIVADSVHAVAVYMGGGSKNIAIKNLIIENGNETNTGCATLLPSVKYAAGQGFDFEGDINYLSSGSKSYSAGIAMRSSLPPRALQDTNRYLVIYDTIPNSNNILEGNDIRGFGYGIISLGYGPLWDFKTTPPRYVAYNNNHNVIRNNAIHSVCKTGIVLGHESNTLVKGNRIWGIIGASPAVGIQVGGMSKQINASQVLNGYNVNNITVEANEISGIDGDVARGISFEQDRNQYTGGTSIAYFPEVGPNDLPIKIDNNVIWGVRGDWRSGIYVATDRSEKQSTPWNNYITPDDMAFRLQNALIANNTVLMDNDGNRINTGATAAVTIQNAAKARLINNALAITDVSLNPNGETALVLYQGVMPAENVGLFSDYNAYWIAPNVNAATFRFIETESDNSIVTAGDRNEYLKLEQWRNWTSQDVHSVFGNWVKDMTFAATNPPHFQMVASPLGSVLENRGFRLPEVSTDFNGRVRGQAGQKYDIGAYEFSGTMYVSDMEGISITAPGSYRASTGVFNDAEYIMTQAPVEVSAIYRNSGSVIQSGVDVEVKIYRQDPNGNWVLEMFDSVKTAAVSTDYTTVNFGLANGVLKEFYPKTYSDLANLTPKYVVPTRFASMQGNVTPLYRIEVKIESDENNLNNTLSKEVRFFIKRSAISLLVSAENSNLVLNVNSTPDEIAGRLNYDTLMYGMKRLGWVNEFENNRYEIDVFERTGWEPRATDYSMYRSLFWSDADDKPLSRQNQIDLVEFLSEGNLSEKKNLMISSQDMVRSLNNEFTLNVLRSQYVAPGNPLGAGVSGDGLTVKGASIGRDRVETILATDYPNDNQPYPGLVKVFNSGDGVSRIAYYYTNHPAAKNDSAMGVSTTTLSSNIANLSVDWRHYANVEMILRALVDFIEKNGGTVVDVELANFDANVKDKSVELNWMTASEIGSAKFEVERADVNSGIVSAYTKINEVKAAGMSAVNQYYNTTDANVTMGSTYSYRLKMIDVNGDFDYSDSRQVTLTSGTVISSIVTLPNPASITTKVKFVMEEAAQATIEVYDMAGRSVLSVSNEYGIGDNDVQLDVSKLSAGSYNVVLRSGSALVSAPLTIVR